MTLANSTTLNIGDSDIILGSLSVSEASSGSTEFSIGTAIAKRLSFQLKNFNDEYSAYDFNDAQIVATITADADSTVDEANGIVSGFGGTMGSDSVVTLNGASMNDNGIVTLSGSSTTDNYTLGVFYVVEKPNYNGGTITFNALDGLYKTDRDYTTALTFPATLLQIYNELCTNCGIVPAQATIPNANYSVPVKPNLDATTAADMLCYIAQVSGTFAQMNSQGKLELKRYGDTSHSLSETFSMEVDTDDVVITGVKVTECFDETDTLKRQTVLNGTAAYALAIAENPLIGSGKAQAVADFLTSVYVGMQFRPLRITVPTNPEVHVGDSIVFTDYKGNTYSTYATEVDFSTNAPTTIAMNAASPERNSAVRYSAEAKALAESKRLVENEKTARELAIEQIAQQIAGAGGMYETTVAQTGGGNIYYLHNKPTLAESTTILRIDDTGIYISNDGGQTYPIGLDYSGTEILDKIYAIGIDADYITTGKITSAQSGFGFDLDNGSGNIGGWQINSNSLGTTTTVTYPGGYFTADDVTAARNAFRRNCTAAEYKYALEHYDLNMDGRVGMEDVSYIQNIANGQTISYDRTIEMSPYGVVPYKIESDFTDRSYTLLSAGSITLGNGSGSATIFNSGSSLLFTNSETGVGGYFSISNGSISYKHATSQGGDMTISGGLVADVSDLTSVHYSNGIVFDHSFTYGTTDQDKQGWLRVLSETGGVDPVIAFEIATGNGAGVKEQIVVRQYNTSNAVARELKLFDTSGNTSVPGKLYTKTAFGYIGANSTYDVIKFKEGDEWGQGVIIGAGGLTVIGGGESADAIAATYSSGGEEALVLTSDQAVYVKTGVQNGAAKAKTSTFYADGTLEIPNALHTGDVKYYGHIVGGADGTVNMWVCLGTLTSSGDSSNVIITLYTGDGYNGNERQNTTIRIRIKDGYQSTHSTSSAFGATVTFEDSPNMAGNDIWKTAVRVRATAYNVCQVWVKLPWSYYNGEYTVEGRFHDWVHSGARQSSDPTSGVSQSVDYYGSWGIGKNTSGYIRFSQGANKMQIAWKQVTVSTAWTSAWNSLWESSLIDVGGWAASFNARPASAAAAFGNGNTRGAMFESNTGASATSAGKYYLVNTGKITDSASMIVTVIAVGSW